MIDMIPARETLRAAFDAAIERGSQQPREEAHAAVYGIAKSMAAIGRRKAECDE
jgi:hypothetical protein